MFGPGAGAVAEEFDSGAFGCPAHATARGQREGKSKRVHRRESGGEAAEAKEPCDHSRYEDDGKSPAALHPHDDFVPAIRRAVKGDQALAPGFEKQTADDV